VYARCTDLDGIMGRETCFRWLFFGVLLVFASVWPALVFLAQGAHAVKTYNAWFATIVAFAIFEEAARSTVRASLRRRLASRSLGPSLLLDDALSASLDAEPSEKDVPSPLA
jgi:hypothetical protein